MSAPTQRPRRSSDLALPPPYEATDSTNNGAVLDTHSEQAPETTKYQDEKAILKQRDAEQNASSRDNPYSNPYTSPVANQSSQRGFFRSSISNLREAFSGPWQTYPRLTAAERNASQMEQFARRLEVQNRMGPSAAEAEKRVLQLQSDAAQASTRAGPRVSTGIFKASCSTDLLFLIDATGSMMPYIEAAKAQVKEIVNDINRTFFNEADVRVAVVAYRDHGEKQHFQFLDFTADVHKVFKFLDKLTAFGGGDTAEDVLGGLDQALKASWKHQTRCIMHIADAPAHGSNLHDMGREKDHFHMVGKEPHGLQYQLVLKEMINRKLNYVFFRIKFITDRMLFQFMMVYGQHTTACKLHLENKHMLESRRWLKSQTARNRAHMQRTSSDKEYAEKKKQDEGGLYFAEVQLGSRYSSLRQLVVNGVTASSSRTAVRLSSSLSANGRRNRLSTTNSKLAHQKAPLSDLTEEDEVDVFEDCCEWLNGRDIRGARDAADASTLAETIVEVDEEDEKDEEGKDPVEPTKPNPFEFDTSEPQWNVPGWLDQTMHVKAFSPDVIDIAPPTSAAAGQASEATSAAAATAAAAPGAGTSILDRMMLSDDNIRISTNELVILRRTKPFAQGALRFASYARTRESTNPLVVKTFKANGKRLADLAEDMRVQALCKAFALEFNSLVTSEAHALDFIVVTCLQPMTAEGVVSSGNGAARDEETQECLSLEPMLDNGRYVKYNNNCGSVNDDSGSEISKAAQAFSHFTFERSRGELLVADLQGVDNVLTDPAIHTRDPHRFVLTDTNLGVDGFKLFFSTHTCNSVCETLGLRSKAEMFISNDFDYRTDWPAITYHHATAVHGAAATSNSSNSGPNASKRSGKNNEPDRLVCCSNKLCSKIVRVSTAKKTPPSFYWCNTCWPQLRSSTVKRVCATPGAFHDFEVSKFFFESQGQLMPQTCAAHGGVPSLPVAFAPKAKALAFFKRRRPGAAN
ncbi:hypothetical protein HMPREF1624_04601 [Sporothrix schenckii ATCC 58251]|uniref:Alpha-type protein kinase domain-containing protein n=1 Tax=Sporothrix schenckii (strain ATCC 58251 / de Perez 2211183) TaxID=1391915 RepID=U7PWW5_SPOS1|nr:hypothetical protein HMPREF1624_04601 [Sporothrix schenckii ATCC 58251]